MNTDDSDPTSSLSKDQSKALDLEEGPKEKGGDESDKKESTESDIPQINETDKKESEGNASEEKDVTSASEGVKMDTSQPLAEVQTNHENVPSSKNPSSETNLEEKPRERNLSGELKKGEIKIKSGMTQDDEDSLVIDEAGDDDAKSESDKAAGSEVCISMEKSPPPNGNAFVYPNYSIR